MEIVNFGSMNMDYVYTVPDFVRPGETLAVESRAVYCGGKGLNQSVAAARAGAAVRHAGMLGAGGEALRAVLERSGADTALLADSPLPQGHTVIQVSGTGENCILLCRGSNGAVTAGYIRQVLDRLPAPAYVLTQNETSGLADLLALAAARGHRVCLNASPVDEALLQADLGGLAWLLINRLEGAQLTGAEEPRAILDALEARYPAMGVVLTLGREGAWCRSGGRRLFQPSFPARAVDTTGAGDTFTGYFLAMLARERPLEEALSMAAMAAAIAVTRPGAEPSIPREAEVRARLAQVR